MIVFTSGRIDRSYRSFCNPVVPPKAADHFLLNTINTSFHPFDLNNFKVVA